VQPLPAFAFREMSSWTMHASHQAFDCRRGLNRSTCMTSGPDGDGGCGDGPEANHGQNMARGARGAGGEITGHVGRHAIHAAKAARDCTATLPGTPIPDPHRDSVGPLSCGKIWAHVDCSRSEFEPVTRPSHWKFMGSRHAAQDRQGGGGEPGAIRSHETGLLSIACALRAPRMGALIPAARPLVPFPSIHTSTHPHIHTSTHPHIHTARRQQEALIRSRCWTAPGRRRDPLPCCGWSRAVGRAVLWAEPL
jgi:hypothetical protein